MKHTPHSIYVKERETLDNGFSAGWGLHFQPAEEYVIDCHTHTDFEGTAEEFKALLDRWFFYTEAYRQQKIVLFVETESQMESMAELMKIDGRVQWMLYLPADKPRFEWVKKSKKLGACGLKIHSHTIMKGEVPFECFYSPDWQGIFKFIEDNDMPALWHVTQRVSYSPYHGGGFNAYFSEGQKKGINVTNEMLLKQLCDVLEAYPKLNIIGAHQLYLGIPALSELFDKYTNLYIDSSVGYFVRWCDTIYDDDRELYYEFFNKYPEKILFGTDSHIAPNAIGEYQKETFCNHLRFIHQLRLPYDVLEMVCHKNAERLLKIPPSSSSRKYNTRP